MARDRTLSLTSFAGKKKAPSYAILSHTWGEVEATFQDLKKATAGELVPSSDPRLSEAFDKLYFCGRQAAKDDLQYFWVDTCCIDKGNHAELSAAINSMFKWYQSSAKCYALLTDVSVPEGGMDQTDIEAQLRRSRWFTRGWTLQELLAPTVVEFFSKEGTLIGSKKTLEKLLSEITQIPLSALRGAYMTNFTVQEKMSWVETRQTTCEEDIVYCLLGMCGVYMPPIYGEGIQYARRRLQHEIQSRAKDGKGDDQLAVLDSSSVWIVPFERNLRFTGDTEVSYLEDKLFSQDQFSKVALWGLGGVGKSQAVLELLHRRRDKNSQLSAIWLQATTIDTLDRGYHAVAKRLGILTSDKDGMDIKKLVQEHLSEARAGHWILVFDGADDINMWLDKPRLGCQESMPRVLDYLPRSKYGRVIFTTRDRKAAVKFAQSNVHEVQHMKEGASQQMLRNLLIDEHLVDSRPADAKAMLAWLAHLPLAIAQAAAFINENRITLANYLELATCREEEVAELLEEEFEDAGRYSDARNPVATTWLTSFQQIQQCDPLAAEYLAFMACLDHKDIPRLLLPPGPSRKKEVEAIGTLTAYSFITSGPEDTALAMHRLVHLAVRHWLRKEGVLAEWTRKVAERLGETFPERLDTDQELLALYLSHSRKILESDLLLKDDAGRIGLEWHVAVSHFNDGRWGEAESRFQRVMEYRTRILGPEHPDTLRSMSKLAWTYHSRSWFNEAKALGEKALDSQQRVLGEDDPETLTTMSNLAMTYSDLSQWQESETLELQAFSLRTRVLGAEHPDTLISMSNLVYLYNCQGLWEKAATLGAATTATRQKVLGPDHPSTLLSVGNLAHTYNNLGRYAEAETLLSQVVVARTRLLGRHHPHTLSGMSNLAMSYHHQGRYAEAEALQGEVAAVRTETLGGEHFSTLTSLAHLVATYHKQGRLGEAEELGRTVAERRGRVLGGEHHHTLASLGALAAVCRDLGELGRAEELGVQVLAVRVGALGLRHPHVLGSMGELAETYRRMGRVREAEDLEAQVAEAEAEGV